MDLTGGETKGYTSYMMRRIISALLIVTFLSTTAWALLEICRCGMEHGTQKASSHRCCNGPEKASERTCDGHITVPVEKYIKPNVPVSKTEPFAFTDAGRLLLGHDLLIQTAFSNLFTSPLEKLPNQTITPLRL